jgi:hypothetical protein
MDKDYNILLKRLDNFIRRYYLNQIIKGLILGAAIVGSFFLIVSLFEYLGHFSTLGRTIIFFFSVALIVIVFFWFIIRPLLGFMKIGKMITYKEAAKILSVHFGDIQDKLENTLELAEMLENEEESSELLLAAIAQKTEKLKPIPFLQAVPFSSGFKYIKYAVPPVLFILIVLFFWPSVISEGTERIVKYRTEFIEPPPFEFKINNESLSIRKGDDVLVSVTTIGRIIPENIWINFNGNRLLMQEVSVNQFEYNFKNINNSLSLYFESSDIKSEMYAISVLPAPDLLNFQITVAPPKYTGEEIIKNTNQGDFSMPAGSHVSWSFNTRETDNMNVVFSDSTILTARHTDDFFFADTSLIYSTSYSLELSNSNFGSEDAIQYSVHVIPDLYPEIKIQEIRDSIDMNIFYFNGLINDDYGFNSLNFCYSNSSTDKNLQKILVPFNKYQSPQELFFAFDFSQFKDQDISSIRYFFEVGDNDAINGSKITRSQIGEFRFPSIDEINQVNEKTNDELEEKINQAKDINKSLRKDIEDLQRKLIDKKMTPWEREQSVQQIVDKQNALEKLAEDIANKNQERNKFMDSYANQQESIVEKKKQIEDLVENLMNDELREMIDELNELMKNNETEDINKLMEELDYSYEDLDKQLDNQLEMLKELEVDERIQNSIDELEKLSEKHEKLSEKTKDKNEDSEELLSEQKKHEEDLDKIKKDYEKTLEKNKELSEPKDMQEFQEQFDQIQQEMSEGEKNLEDGKENKASKNQKSSSEQMKKLGEAMKKMQDKEMMSSTQENMEDLRQLLENLVQFSFDQEDLINDFNQISVRDPRFRITVNNQSKLEDRFEMINDSLTALGARVPQIGNIIRKEQKSINSYLNDVMTDISNNRIYKVRTNQQLIMTHANNLALLLSEVMDQMEQQMNSTCSCPNGSCQKKSGQGKPKMGEMRSRQQSMKGQLQQMIEMMKSGKQSGGKQGQKQMSKQIAKMLAEQEIMQQMLSQMMSSESISPDAAKVLREINKMMQDNINDLVNRNITPNLLTRQEQIVTRMLEAEKSEFEREIDKQRKSQEARTYKISNPEKAFKEARKKDQFNELLEYSNLKMNRFYKDKYKEYLLKISQ